MLSKICGLKQDEITEIITKTDILSVIDKIYFTLNQEGDHAAMFHIKEALAVRGVDINIPGIESRVWRLWNFVEEEYVE